MTRPADAWLCCFCDSRSAFLAGVRSVGGEGGGGGAGGAAGSFDTRGDSLTVRAAGGGRRGEARGHFSRGAVSRQGGNEGAILVKETGPEAWGS
jgi:hypothetical protein